MGYTHYYKNGIRHYKSKINALYCLEGCVDFSVYTNKKNEDFYFKVEGTHPETREYFEYSFNSDEYPKALDAFRRVYSLIQRAQTQRRGGGDA